MARKRAAKPRLPKQRIPLPKKTGGAMPDKRREAERKRAREKIRTTEDLLESEKASQDPSVM